MYKLIFMLLVFVPVLADTENVTGGAKPADAVNSLAHLLSIGEAQQQAQRKARRQHQEESRLIGTDFRIARAGDHKPCTASAPCTSSNSDEPSRGLVSHTAGWTALPGSIEQVVPPYSTLGVFRGSGGPGAMPLWSGATLGNGSMWFWGGGHSDYGGNEVYEYDLDTEAWRCYGPWLDSTDGPSGCKNPIGAPPSAHSASGLWWAHGELWVSGYSAFCKGGGSQQGMSPNVWSFNPETGQWTARGSLKMVEPHTAYDAKRDLLYVWKKRQRLDIYDGSTLQSIEHTDGPLDYVADYSHLLIDDDRRKLYGISRGKMYIWSLNETGALAGDQEVVEGMPSARNGYALRDGKLYIRPGDSNVRAFDLDTRAFETIESNDGPTRKYDRIFSKWQYDAERDRFLGLSSFDNIYQWRPIAPKQQKAESKQSVPRSGWHLDPISSRLGAPRPGSEKALVTSCDKLISRLDSKNAYHGVQARHWSRHRPPGVW